MTEIPNSPTQGVSPSSGRPPEPETGASKSGPPAGFGKGVNDYLNDYVKVADAKAGAFLAAALTVIGLTLRLHPTTDPSKSLRWVALAALAGSLFASAYAIFPRLPGSHRNLIFWEGIRNTRSGGRYWQELRPLDQTSVEKEYAEQNWSISNVLHTKYRLLQWAIVLFLAGSALAGLTYQLSR